MLSQSLLNLSEAKWRQEYAEFLADSFDSTEFVHHAASRSELSNCVSQLQFKISNIQKQIHQFLAENYQSLLKNLDELNNVEASVRTIIDGTRELEASFEKVEKKLKNPLKEMEERLKFLKNTHGLLSMLRKIEEIQSLSRKLTLPLSNRSKADTIHHIEHLASDEELEGIEFVKEAKKACDTQKEALVIELVTQVAAYFSQGTPISQADLANVLSSLRVLGQLETCIDRVNHLVHKQNEQKLQEVFASTSVETLFAKFVQLFELFEDLLTKFDVLDAALKIIDVPMQNLSQNFFKQLSNAVERQLRNPKNQKTVQSALSGGGFIRLLKMINDLFEKLTIQLNRPLNAERQLFTFLNLLETNYLNKSLQRLFDSVNAALQSKMPSKSDLLMISKSITNELEVSKLDPKLHRACFKNVCKCIQLFCVKTESLVQTQPEAYRLSSELFLKNLDFANAVAYLIDSLESSLQENSPLRQETFYIDAYSNAYRLIQLVFGPLQQHLLQPLEQCLNKLSVTVDIDLVTQEFDDKLRQLVEKQLVSHLSSSLKRLLFEWLKRFVDRLLVSLLRNFTLVSVPSEPQTKNELLGVLKRFETIIGDLTALFQLPLAHFIFGNNLLAFKSLRRLFVTETQAIGKQWTKRVSIGYLVQHIISRSSTELLKQPHKRFLMELGDYFTWLDQHTEQEWLKLIEETVLLYASDADQKGEKVYAVEYLAIKKLLQ